MANNVRRYSLGILYALRQTRAPCSGAHCAPQKCGPVRRKTAAGHTSRPDLYAPRLTNGHGEQCSPLRSRHFVRPAPKPVPPVAAHIVRHKMQTRSPRNRGGAHVPAGPVRPSPIERPWRTMFAATVSAFCTPYAETRATCSGAHCAPQNADLFATKCGPVRRKTAAGAHVSAGPGRRGANGPRDSRTARDLVQCAQDPAPFVVRMANGETARAGARQAACGRAGAPARGGQSGPAGA